MMTVECAVEPTVGGVDSEAGVCIIPVVVAEGDASRDSRKGTKLSPICIDEDMKKAATPSEELKKQCFPEEFSLIEAQLEVVPGITSASFSSSSTMTKHNMYAGPDGDTDMVLTKLMEKSILINSTVADRTISRHGRSSQRWLVDSSSTKVTRLVTGCVPILLGGRIMLVSASKKNEWILPKGGWELDEEMEESAIRETFEEAGVIGVLGPRLTEVQYETRKARERRLALEEKLKAKPEANSQFSSGWSDVSQLSEDDHILSDKHEQSFHKAEQSDAKGKQVGGAEGVGTESEMPAPITKETASAGAKKQNGTGHLAAESTMVYSHVCVSLFPLYVKDVMSSWPESGRLRKSAAIDEAIELLAARPEMQSLLMEVKARGLHRV